MMRWVHSNTMLHYVFLAYIVLYAIIAVGMFSLHALIVPPKDKKDDKPWETPLDIVLSLIGRPGCCFFTSTSNPIG
jgi:hypothetical protein